MNIFSLKGKVVAVTGGTRGIGRILVISLAKAGADVALLQRDICNTEVKKKIEAIGSTCEIIQCDLSNKKTNKTSNFKGY